MSYQTRFSGIRRLYGSVGAERLKNAHVAVVGLGGVGSWSVEALARTGIGQLTLIDLDDIVESNINRQLHALSNTLHSTKVDEMTARVLQINPDCKVNAIEDFVTKEGVSRYLGTQHDVIIDAIDAVAVKAAMIAFAKRNKIKIITVGGAGGQTNPLLTTKGDLAKTIQDPLSAKVRSELRRLYNFSKNPKRRFGIECIYSTEQLKFPTPDGGVSQQKQQAQGSGKMDCSTGFGAFVGVTSSFGMLAASRAIDHLVKLDRPTGSN
ncbi:tRNA cyclic N6-threonylcarbamoyladenosine(37) synthase TcdA [Agaribacter flavus]|uniref:tRNA cyclic N6-threonylcarbamoyladenosine(37) synthase TcdA n=1 Tax=Agaribacter flavus TaxID=1902781 RepID=A0ABV7FK17_9ALTE